MEQEISPNNTLMKRLMNLIQNLPEKEKENLFFELQERYPAPRKNSRIDYSIDITYSAKGHIFTDYVKDISTTGVFIEFTETSEAPDILSTGDIVSLVIPVQDHKQYIKAEGKIARKTKYGIGVEFINTKDIKPLVCKCSPL